MNESLNNIELIRNSCIELFSLRDFVMEPQVIPTLLAFFQANGKPEQVVSLLARNYFGFGQIANLLGCWLSDLENENETPSTFESTNSLLNANQKIEKSTIVKECFEETISSMILKMFCAESADKVFENDGNEGIDWLPELIMHKPWRRLIFKLIELYPNCLMLNFAVKLISDAGFQHEISNVNTAAQQLNIFSRVFLSSIDRLLAEYSKNGPNNEVYEKAFLDLERVACHSSQTFLYTQALLYVLCLKETDKAAAGCHYIAQTLRLNLQKKNQNISTMCIAMLQSNDNLISANIVQAMLTMINKKELNPADIAQLYEAYFSSNPPPVTLIRYPYFVDMLIDALFNLNRPKISSAHCSKYIYLLSYAASVVEKKINGVRIQTKNELELIQKNINELYEILHDMDTELIMHFYDLLRLIKLPVVAVGMLYYVKCLINQDEYLTEPLLLYFVLIDEIASQHSNLHFRIFKMLCKLYDQQSVQNEIAEIIMQRQREIIDRFVHLSISGYAIKVNNYIYKMFKDGQIDDSLVRYFGSEIMEYICAPYSNEFVKSFLPIVENSEIFDELTLEKNANLKKFLSINKNFVK